jgi:hypothetical protein
MRYACLPQAGAIRFLERGYFPPRYLPIGKNKYLPTLPF